jgi:hypothetical protein
MIAIDLTPKAIQICRAGRVRWGVLQTRALVVLVVLALCSIWQNVGLPRAATAALVDIQGEVAQLEQQLAQHAQEQLAAQKEHDRGELAQAAREVIPVLLDLISGESHDDVSLSKLQITLDEVTLEGCARDAHAIAWMIEQVSRRCPRVQSSVEKMRTISVVDQNVESFQARLSFSVKQHGASWCRDGGAHEG